jgi:hypothetical protein
MHLPTFAVAAGKKHEVFAAGVPARAAGIEAWRGQRLRPNFAVSMQRPDPAVVDVVVPVGPGQHPGQGFVRRIADQASEGVVQKDVFG